MQGVGASQHFSGSHPEGGFGREGGFAQCRSPGEDFGNRLEPLHLQRQKARLREERGPRRDDLYPGSYSQ